MITDAIWSDINGDKLTDLLLVGEYMPISVFMNQAGKLVNVTQTVGLGKTNGWWNTIESGDLDKDGDLDFVVGNLGLNSRFRASVDKPVSIYVNDFDKNGTVEQIICTYNGNKSYPLVLRHDLMTQIPSLKKKYLKYHDFKDQTITDIFTPDELANAVKFEAYEFSSGLLINDGKGGLIFKSLPREAQFSIVYAINVEDFDNDGNLDIVLGGNLYSVKPEMGRYDASYGLFLRGDGNGNFRSIPTTQSGLNLKGEIRDLITVNVSGRRYLLAARNNESVLVFKVN